MRPTGYKSYIFVPIPQRSLEGMKTHYDTDHEYVIKNLHALHEFPMHAFEFW